MHRLVGIYTIAALTFLPALTPAAPLDPNVAHGQKIWFENTYGGEKFFQILAHFPDPRKQITVGFDQVVNTQRSQRFQTWGTINDPDCYANPAGGPDICPDPTASGVIGIRKFSGPGGTNYGISCASCHAGFSPLHPPLDVNEPRWMNIHPTIGNQYLDSGKIFAANLPASDVRRLMFAAWPKGTVDTTLLFSDNIMNPGVITAFWNLNHRPVFDVGLSEPKMRSGQGGEDDLGGDVAALRVYTNIGVCFQECVAPNPGKPIDIAQCQKVCPDFPSQLDRDDLVSFLKTIKAPKFPRPLFMNWQDFNEGKRLFATNCASCHSMAGKSAKILSNDEVNALVSDPMNTTNACRSLSTNWEAGQIWAQFSSQVYKDRAQKGLRGYRTMPLVGIWATSPFMHNQSIGEWAQPNATVAQRARAYEHSMLELLEADRPPVVYTSPVAVGPFPVGTPLIEIFSRDPATGQLLCDDVVENRGHHYGSSFTHAEKHALIYWLKFQ